MPSCSFLHPSQNRKTFSRTSAWLSLSRLPRLGKSLKINFEILFRPGDKDIAKAKRPSAAPDGHTCLRSFNPSAVSGYPRIVAQPMISDVIRGKKLE
jgi:hypothetical protein